MFYIKIVWFYHGNLINFLSYLKKFEYQYNFQYIFKKKYIFISIVVFLRQI